MRELELLAPARGKDIGIAAIDCGADAVYIAASSFGARAAAGNSVEDIGELCSYAHRFGARIFVTVNTIVYEEELEEVRRLILDLERAGADALIVQDPAVFKMCSEISTMAIHASTQCAIRTPETALFYEGLGAGRVVLERQLSIEEIRSVRERIGAEIEFFVHGALCVCYSGQCYLSEEIAGRSANRGACVQACRSLYDLVDGDGKVLVRNKALLSLKDFNLLRRLEDLAEAGVDSFKIEGRLKDEGYVRNTVLAYSKALDALVAKYPDRYRRASFGRVSGGFAPDLNKTFNRGYTELFIDGKRGSWSSMDTSKSLGEFVGTIASVGEDSLRLDLAPGVTLSNGDGFTFALEGGTGGFRSDICRGNTVSCRGVSGLRKGMKLYRNASTGFDRVLSSERPVRRIGVTAGVRLTPERVFMDAVSEDGRTVSVSSETSAGPSRNPEKTLSLVGEQVSKNTGIYAFSAGEIAFEGPVPYLSAGEVNALRRKAAGELDALPVRAFALRKKEPSDASFPKKEITYKENVANSVSRKAYLDSGASPVESAFELTHRKKAELMRTRYCIRYELGLCPKYQGAAPTGPLCLRNNGRLLSLSFDCLRCEMTVSD